MKDEILKKAKEGNEFVFSDYSYLTLTESDIHDICCALKQNQNLRTLDVSKSLRLEIFSSIYAKKIIFIFDEICRILEENRNINSLVLSNNSLGYHFPQENVVQLLSIIKGRENIISLDLSNNEFFAGPYPTIIFGLIDSHKNLQQLFLRGNRLFDIGSEYFKVLSWALLNNKRLLELDLRNNTQEGYQNRYNLKVLLEMICIHPCITYIDLRGNDFEKYLGFILLGTLNNLFTRTQLREIKFDSEKINKQDIILGDLLEKSGMKDLISGKKDAWKLAFSFSFFMKKIKKNMPQEILEEILSYSTADTQFIDNIKNKIPWWVDQNRYSVTGYLSLTREERETFLLEKFGSADRKYVFSSNWILGFPTNFTEAVAFFRKSLNHEKYNVAAVQPFWKAVSGVPRTIQKLREIVNSQKPPLTDEERLKEIGKFFSEKPYLKDPTSKTVYLQRLYRLIEKILQFVSVSPHNSPAPKI